MIASRLALAAVAAAAAPFALPAAAPASIKISSDTAKEQLRVDAAGRAQITWRAADGRRRTAVVSGDRIRYNATVRGRAGRRVDAGIPQAIAQVRLRDGRTYALQKVQRLGSYGRLGPVELRFSRWYGEPTRLTLAGEWVDGKIPRICGTATFHGVPFYGQEHTPQGNPLDDEGRNVYLDVLQPSGAWYRIFGVLTRPLGYALLLRTTDWYGSAFRGMVPGPNVDGQLAPDAIETASMPDRSARNVCPFPPGQYAGQ